MKVEIETIAVEKIKFKLTKNEYFVLELLSEKSKIDLYDILNAEITSEQWLRLTKVAAEIAEIDIAKTLKELFPHLSEIKTHSRNREIDFEMMD